MEKKELINSCRYYKGEEKCPFDPKDVNDNRAALWYCEESWCRDMEKVGESAFRHDLEEYNGYGAGEEISTRLPASLLARIFNRYAEGFCSMADAAADFARFYAVWYGEPSGA